LRGAAQRARTACRHSGSLARRPAERVLRGVSPCRPGRSGAVRHDARVRRCSSLLPVDNRRLGASGLGCLVLARSCARSSPSSPWARVLSPVVGAAYNGSANLGCEVRVSMRSRSWLARAARGGRRRRRPAEKWNEDWRVRSETELASSPSRCGAARSVVCGRGGVAAQLARRRPHALCRASRYARSARGGRQALESFRGLLGRRPATAAVRRGRYVSGQDAHLCSTSRCGRRS